MSQMVICEIKEEKRGDGWREEKGEASQKGRGKRILQECGKTFTWKGGGTSGSQFQERLFVLIREVFKLLTTFPASKKWNCFAQKVHRVCSK